MFSIYALFANLTPEISQITRCLARENKLMDIESYSIARHIVYRAVKTELVYALHKLKLALLVCPY